MLGTGNALVTKCYNTCFIIENENDYFMVDAGGGNTVLNQLEKAKINWKEIKHIIKIWLTMLLLLKNCEKRL